MVCSFRLWGLFTVMRFYGYEVLRFYGYGVLRLWGLFTVMRLWGYTVVGCAVMGFVYGYEVLRLWGYEVMGLWGFTVVGFAVVGVWDFIFSRLVIVMPHAMRHPVYAISSILCIIGVFWIPRRRAELKVAVKAMTITECLTWKWLSTKIRTKTITQNVGCPITVPPPHTTAKPHNRKPPQPQNPTTS